MTKRITNWNINEKGQLYGYLEDGQRIITSPIVNEETSEISNDIVYTTQSGSYYICDQWDMSPVA